MRCREGNVAGPGRGAEYRLSGTPAGVPPLQGGFGHALPSHTRATGASRMISVPRPGSGGVSPARRGCQPGFFRLGPERAMIRGARTTTKVSRMHTLHRLDHAPQTM